MKLYLLLRENRESGPYMLDGLKEMRLRPMDLVWIEGESTAWAYPADITELKAFVSEDHIPKRFYKPKSINQPVSSSCIAPETASEGHLLQPLVEFRESYREPLKRPVWRKRSVHSFEIFNLAFVFAGILFGAVVFRKAMDSFQTGQLEDAGSPVIAKTVPPGTASAGSEHIAIDRNVVPASSRIVEKNARNHPILKEISKQLMITASVKEPVGSGDKAEWKLTVRNLSPHLVERLVLAVDHLDEKGSVVGSEQYDLTMLSPGNSKDIDVARSQGVKLEYRIVSVSSRQYRVALKQA